MATCGSKLSNWVPLTGSQWDVDAVVNGSPENYAVSFARPGSAVTATGPVPNVAFTGSYITEPDARTITWEITGRPFDGILHKFRTAPVQCTAADKVLTAAGAVVHINVGAVGTFTMTRTV